MSTALATLPTTSDQSRWSPEEKALIEAAGLVHTDAQSGAKTLADRPVVAAFLQHCAKTGLDPIARQIYSIARKSKGQLRWQIQISIDGARLVAERSGEYEGQTTPEFTSDGQTWTQVWLAKEPPAAARVGVYRRGFREPLYAVALWDAYVQTKYDGSVSDMWRKMGPLMLAKCAEMLALRKAFPQDLSGLYSAEEMDQSVSVAEPQAAQVAVAAPVEAPVEAAPVWEREQVDAFLRRVAAETQLEPLFAMYGEAKEDGALGLVVDAQGTTVEALLWERRRAIEAGEVEPEQADEPEEVVEPESVPMALDVDGGAS